MQPIGSFEPSYAKRVIELLEEKQIPFQVEVDDSRLLDPTRSAQLAFGMYPDGSRVVLSVTESRLTEAMEMLKNISPV